jgi:hypothetical protein
MHDDHGTRARPRRERADDISGRGLRLAAVISIGALPLALWSCNSPDATVGGPDGGSPGGTGGAAQGSSGQGGAGGQASGTGGAGGIGGAGGGGEIGPKALWAKSFGSMNGTEYSYGIAIDSVGDIYITGSFNAAVNVDGNLLFPPSADTDLFIAKFNPAGVYQWSKAFGGPGDDEPLAIGTDGLKIVVTGIYDDVLDLGGGQLPDGAFYGDVFVAAYEPTGAFKWAKAFGAPGDVDRPYGVGFDAQGNTVVTGTFRETINFGGPMLTSAGSEDIFVAKLNALGGHVWSKSFGDSSSQTPYAMAVSPGSNRVVLTGVYDGQIDFGGGPLPTAVGVETIFVASLNNDGSHHFSKSFPQDSSVEPAAVKANKDGDIYVGGNFYGAVAFGAFALQSMADNDIFIVKLDPNGTPLWAKAFGDDKVQGVSGMAVDNDGGVIATGYFSGTVDFGGGPLVAASMCGQGEFCHDIYVVKLAADGSFVWARRFGGVDNDFADAVAVESSGGIILSGNYSTMIDFGNAQSLMGDYNDIYLTKLK